MKTLSATSEAEVDRKRLFVPVAAPFYEIFAPLAYTLIRVALGLILIPHGYAKLFGTDAVAASRNFVNFGWAYPLAWAYFIGAVEFFGGILLALGLFTRIVAAAFVIEMSVICFAVLYPNWSWGRRGMEYALFMGIVALAIFFRAAGDGRSTGSSAASFDAGAQRAPSDCFRVGGKINTMGPTSALYADLG